MSKAHRWLIVAFMSLLVALSRVHYLTWQDMIIVDFDILTNIYADMCFWFTIKPSRSNISMSIAAQRAENIIQSVMWLFSVFIGSLLIFWNSRKKILVIDLSIQIFWDSSTKGATELTIFGTILTISTRWNSFLLVGWINLVHTYSWTSYVCPQDDIACGHLNLSRVLSHRALEREEDRQEETKVFQKNWVKQRWEGIL